MKYYLSLDNISDRIYLLDEKKETVAYTSTNRDMDSIKSILFLKGIKLKGKTKIDDCEYNLIKKYLTRYNISISGWDTSQATNFKDMFTNYHSIQSIARWKK